nr:sugar phosphate isomerase/epimerase [Clostridia bacterium]
MSNKKIGISCGVLQRRYGPKEALEICACAGFDAVDFNLEHYGLEKDNVYRMTDDEIVDYFADIKKRADELGILISQTHGRSRSYIPDENYSEWVRSVSRLDLLSTAALGAPACVIHSIMRLHWGEQTPEFMHSKNKEFFDYLIPFAEKYGTSVSLETFGDTCPGGVRRCEFFGDTGELKKQYDMLDTKNKTICMDTGHSHHCAKYGMPDTAEAIRILGNDITLLHLNDNNGHS